MRDLYVNDPVGLFGERERRQFLRVQRIAVNVPDCLALRLADEIQGIAVQGRIEHMNLLNSGNFHILHLLRGDVQTFECTLSTDHLWLCCHQNGIFIQPSGQTDFKILRKKQRCDILKCCVDQRNCFRPDIILIRGFNAAAVSSYEEYASALKIERTSIHSQVFFSCIVDAVDRSIHAYNYLTQDNISMDDIFEFAEETKNDVFYIYDALVVQYDPELLSEIENADIPAANMVQETFSLEQQNEVATLNDWDTSANNRVKIFNSTFAYPNQKTLIIYQNATANSDRLMTCSAGEALLFTGTSVTVGDYAWDEVRGWKQSGSSVSLVKGWYLRSNTEDCLPIYSTGVHIANYCADASFDSTHKRVAFTLLASAKLYNSSGTVIKTLSKGDEVCFTIDDGYAGATRPYLISICGYTVFTNNLGYYTAVTSTTFVDLNFDCGYTGGYRVVTEIDWS